MESMMVDQGNLIKTDRPLRILYFSSHEVLEYDDLRMLTDMGHKVFSIGTYSKPGSVGAFRPASPQFFQPDDYEAFKNCGCEGPEQVTPAFGSRFDLAIVNHFTHLLASAFRCMGDKPIIWRSIGQSNQPIEDYLKHFRDRITIVRYAQAEVSLPGFAGSDAVIYFGKSRDDFGAPWVGGDRFVTFHNGYLTRANVSVPRLDQFQTLEADYPIDLWGGSNEGIASSRGVAPADKQAEILRYCSGYIYIPTVPPSYTLGFMEAAGVGTPLIAPSADFIVQSISKDHLDASTFTKARWEVPSLLGEDSGLVYDDMAGARRILDRLRSDPDFGSRASNRLRSLFLRYFDYKVVAKQWNELLSDLTAPQ
jgi:hypothetical protein